MKDNTLEQAFVETLTGLIARLGNLTEDNIRQAAKTITVTEARDCLEGVRLLERICNPDEESDV